MNSDLYPSPRTLGEARKRQLGEVVSVTAQETKQHRRAMWQPMAVAASVVTVVGLLALQSLVAPAAWAVVPERLDSGRAAGLARDCSSAIRARHFPIAVGDGSLLVAEGRGSSTAVLLAAPGQVQVCVETSSGDFLGVYNVQTLGNDGGAVDGIEGDREGGQALRLVFGRIQAGSTARVYTEDGRVVTASVEPHGGLTYFFAWWPSHADVSRIEVQTASGGTRTLPLPNQAEPSPALSSIP